jgi:hypothetical protein
MLNRLGPTTTGARRKTVWALLIGVAALGLGAGAVYADVELGEAPEVSTPAITLKPAQLTRQRWATFGFTDSEPGVLFQCSLDGSRWKRCASPKLYSGPLAGGRHMFRVRATRSSGAIEPSDPVTYRWWVVLRPPAPRIVRHPTDPTGSMTATFLFSDRQPGVRFQCRLDGARWRSCARRTTYRRMRVGQHRLLVRAVDWPSPRSAPTGFRWRVVRPYGVRFSINGAVSGGPLYPGAAPLRISLTLKNPNGVAIYVTSVRVAVIASPAGCDSAANVSLVQSSASAAAPVKVPARRSVTLPAQRVSAPTIALRDRPVNQDACRNRAFPLRFTGSAHS